MVTEKDFKIDKTENGYRLARTDNNLNMHTHLKNMSACKSVIKNVCGKKIPTNTGFYYLTSLVRLSDDKEYINKVNNLIEVRKSKGKKDDFYKGNITKKSKK